jgi:hypothetical protein
MYVMNDVSMSGKRLKVNTRAVSVLTITLIIIIVVGSVVAGLAAAILLGFWRPFDQIVGSGILDTEEMTFTDFTIVEVGWGFNVDIDQSDSYSISITADDNMFDYIETSKTGNTFKIGLKLGYSYQNTTLKARITMPDLYEVMFSGGVQGTIEGFTSSHDFTVSLSGGCHISIAGAANDLTISLSGGSHLTLSDFPVNDATVTMSGGSHATINLDGRLEGDLSGGSHLTYLGNPTTIDVNKSGGSTVNPP